MTNKKCQHFTADSNLLITRLKYLLLNKLQHYYCRIMKLYVFKNTGFVTMSKSEAEYIAKRENAKFQIKRSTKKNNITKKPTMNFLVCTGKRATV